MTFFETNVDLNNFNDLLDLRYEYVHLGNTSGNFTLEPNKVTTAHVTGNHTLTLPTVSSSLSQTVCIFDFTTVNTSYPSVTNTNIKLKDSLALTYKSFSETKSVTGASNTTPITITINSHGYQTGDVVLIASVGGNTAANGSFTITKTGSNTFTLNDSAGNGNYTSGGTSTLYYIRNRITCTSINGTDNWEVVCESYGGREISFSRPNLVADGTLGGASFAVSNSPLFSTYYAYLGVDGNTGTFTVTTLPNSTFIFYNPAAIKVSTLTIKNADTSGAAITTYEVLGSNNGSSWTSLKSGTNSTTTAFASWDISVNSSTFYKYHKILTTHSAGETYVGITECGITATYMSA